MKLGWAPEILKRWTGAVPAVRASEIQVGDRFFQVGMGPTVWVVERICVTETCKIPHAVITRAGAVPGSKIISTETLADSTLYRVDRRVGAGTADDDNRRRHSDPPLRH